MDYVAGLTGPENSNFYNVRTGEVVPAGSKSAVGMVRKHGKNYHAVIFGNTEHNKICNSEESAVMHVLLLH